MTPIRINIPIETVSEANEHKHWRGRWMRTKTQRTQTLLALMAHRKPRAACYVIHMERIHEPRRRIRDGDNLVSACKATRDAVAQWLGIDDSSDRFRFPDPTQSKGDRPAFVVTIHPLDAFPVCDGCGQEVLP